MTARGKFTPTLDEVLAVALHFFDDVNAKGIELGEADQVKMKYMTTTIFASRS